MKHPGSKEPGCFLSIACLFNTCMASPHMRRDLYVIKPFMSAAGTARFTHDPRIGMSLESLGAYVPNASSLRRRQPTSPAAIIEIPGRNRLPADLPKHHLASVVKAD